MISTVMCKILNGINMIRVFDMIWTWKKFWSASTLSSFTFGSTIGTQRPEKGHQIKTKAAIGSILRDRALFKCLNGLKMIWRWIWRHLPSFSCFLVLKPCVQNIFYILRWYCAKCNFTGDWIRMGLKRNRPKFGSRHCPLGLTWSNHQENHHHQQISLASLQVITRRISIIDKTLPKAQRTRGLSSYHTILQKSW